MNKNVFILSTCNEWKEYSSACIVGVYTDENIIKEKIWGLFEEDDIDWNGHSLTSLKVDAAKEWEESSYYENPEEYDEDFSIEDEIKKIFEEKKNEIYNEIKNTFIDDLDSSCTYLMIQKYALNE